MNFTTLLTPIGVIISVVATWWFSRQTSAGNNLLAIVPNTPANTPVGITTGFAEPLVSTVATALPAIPGAAIQPNPAASGVPNTSAQAQQFNTNPLGPAPGSPVSFYNPIQEYLNTLGIAQAAQEPSAIMRPTGPTIPIVPPSKKGCGCSGGCKTCESPCSTANTKFSDGRGACFNGPSNSPVSKAQWTNLYNNLVTSGSLDPFSTVQQMIYDGQNNNPFMEVPTAPNSF